jgi:serine phosphatase RsbU (regulator of sigma subunit)/tetratricopeptide (TPR) repeat protein
LKKLLYILPALLFWQNTFAQLSPKQVRQVDSLKHIIKTAKHDTIIINAWKAWDNIIWVSDPNLDKQLNEQIDTLCSGNLQGEVSKKEQIFFSKNKAFALNNLGLIYMKRGNSANAIEHFTTSLSISERIDYKKGIANSLNNIGMIYKNQRDFEKAIDFYKKSLKVREEIGDLSGTSNSLNNIGSIYLFRKDYTKAIDYYTQSLEKRKEGGHKGPIASSLNNLGVVYNRLGDLEKAISNYELSLEIKKEIGDKKGIAATLNNIGNIYLDRGDYQTAIRINLQAFENTKNANAASEARNIAKSLYQCYSASSKYQLALEMYELFITIRDSIDSEANQKELIRQEYKYDYERKAAADSVVNAEAQKVQEAKLVAEQAEKKQLESESKRQKLENENQQQQAYFLYGGLALALLFGGFIFNRFRVTQKQKSIIESQKSEVEQQKEKVDEAYEQLEEKNTEILDSINYAKRIQSAILPPDKLVKEYLQSSFILYKPKDIVAGDFYWMEPTSTGILFAVADCTGHGVPGAMVSVVCHNAMNRAVREFGLTDPGKILDKTREIVIQEFEKSEDEVKDGMDIALCSLNDNMLQYAGAHNPLWIIRKGEVMETKATKQPIGQVDSLQPFITHTFELQPNDIFYIFSDGYIDQFGGDRGKKFKAKAFRELLLSIQEKSMEEQRTQINQAFENWRGDLEQVDDVCVIGVKV